MGLALQRNHSVLIQQAGSQFKTLPTYNRTIVAGGKTGGVIVTLTRDGTADDELAPLVTDDLITHQSAGYERGRIETAKSGTWEEMSFTTWLTDYGLAPGLLLPGHLVEIQDLNETYPVQLSGTTINAQSNNQRLTVCQRIGGSMSDVWTQFESLLEKDSTQIATIISTDGVESTVELLSGDRLKVIGTGTPGGNVYIKGGEIKQTAPTLPQHNMILY